MSENFLSEKNIECFCDSLKSMLGAAECKSFSGRLESVAALFRAIDLGSGDCVYVSPLISSETMRALFFCGVTPVFCDVAPDSLTMDHRSLENGVRTDTSLYPRAAIVDNFCGMPFAAKAIKNVCDRLGLILIEDCGSCFGGRSDGTLCGSVGDYSLLSLGSSSVFGTGGSGCLVVSREGNPLAESIASCDGIDYAGADEIYGSALCDSLGNIDGMLQRSRQAAQKIADAVGDSDIWLQHGGGKQKSSFGALAVILPDINCCAEAAEAFEQAGLSRYVGRVHVHRKSCFEGGCYGLKDIDNAASIAPRALKVDIFGALNGGVMDDIILKLSEIAASL